MPALFTLFPIVYYSFYLRVYVLVDTRDPFQSTQTEQVMDLVCPTHPAYGWIRLVICRHQNQRHHT
jgi:hypothetical protein